MCISNTRSDVLADTLRGHQGKKNRRPVDGPLRSRKQTYSALVANIAAHWIRTPAQ
jgi:hypothetical protein